MFDFVYVFDVLFVDNVWCIVMGVVGVVFVLCYCGVIVCMVDVFVVLLLFVVIGVCVLLDV